MIRDVPCTLCVALSTMWQRPPTRFVCGHECKYRCFTCYFELRSFHSLNADALTSQTLYTHIDFPPHRIASSFHEVSNHMPQRINCKYKHWHKNNKHVTSNLNIMWNVTALISIVGGLIPDSHSYKTYSCEQVFTTVWFYCSFRGR